MAVAARHSWMDELRETHQTSIHLSCKAACIAQASYYYKHKQDDDDEIVDVLLKLVERAPKWGFPKCRDRIRALGYGWNHKRIYRIYTQLGLNLRSTSADCQRATLSHWQSLMRLMIVCR